MSKIVCFSTVIILVAAIISMNVILLGSIPTHLLYAQHDDNINGNNLLTVHKAAASFPFIPPTTSPSPKQTMARSSPAISNVSQSNANQETASNGNSTFLTYKNSNYGIQIQYPSTWIKVTNHSNEIVRFMSPPGTVRASLNIIVRTDASQFIPIQVYVNAGIEVLKKIFPAFNLVSSNATTLGGIPAQKMTYTANLPSGPKLKFLQFFAIRDDTSYVVTTATSPGDFPKYLPTLQRMISSLSFISPTTLLSTSNETVLRPNQTALSQLRNTTSSLVLHQAPKPIPPSSNNTYTNSTDGISFSVPQGWTTEEGRNQANATRLTVVTVSPPIALDPSAVMQVIIEKDTNPLTSSIDQYIRDQLNSYRDIPSNNLMLISANTSNITLSGQPAYSLLFTYTPHVSYAGPLSEHSEVGTLLNGQGYIIDYYGSKDLFSKLLPQVQQIIKTFEIHRPNVYAQQRGGAATTGVTTLANKGNALVASGNYTQAIQYYDKALDIDPNLVLALTGKANVLFGLRNYTQAIQYYDKALAIDPNDKVALTGKGLSLNDLGNYTQAIPYFDKALAIDPNDKLALTSKGDSLNGLDNYTQAMPYLDKALAIDPNYGVALNDKGVALYGLGNYTQAIQWFNKASAIDPNYKEPLYNKGASLNALDNYTQAIPYIDKALAIDPNYQEALTSKGESLEDLGNYTQAMPYLDKALTLDPNDKVALNDKGYALSGLGNYTKAIQYYDKALAIVPNYKVALDNKQAALSKTSPRQPQQQQQSINESRIGPAPSPSPYARF